MQRSKPTANQLVQRFNSLLELTGAVVGRANLFSRFGQEYGGDRDLYKALGYKDDLGYVDYMAQYVRHDMAKTIINKPVEATWRGGVTVLESDDDKETAFEKAWKDLYKGLKLHSKFVRIDKLTGIGNYGTLLMGFDDVKEETEFRNPVAGGARKLLYVKPFTCNSAIIKEWDRDPNSERYGQPHLYEFKIGTPGTEQTRDLIVHHTRVVHIVNELLESEYEGLPRLQVLFNRLKDLEKIVGGSAEMFWRGARPGYANKVDPNYTLSSTQRDELEGQLDEYEHNLRRFLTLEGIDVQPLQSQVSDPSNHVDVQLQMISAVTGIPKRILVGSERGELASTQDQTQWNITITARRQDYAQPCILEPFIEKCIEHKVLPKPTQSNWSYQWEDLFAPTLEEKADVGKKRADAVGSYTKNPASMEVLPPVSFLKHGLGLTDDEIELIEQERDQYLKEEQAEIEEERRLLEEERRAAQQQQPPEGEEES